MTEVGKEWGLNWVKVENSMLIRFWVQKEEKYTLQGLKNLNLSLGELITRCLHSKSLTKWAKMYKVKEKQNIKTRKHFKNNNIKWGDRRPNIPLIMTEVNIIKYGYGKTEVQDGVKTWHSTCALGQSWHIWDSFFSLALKLLSATLCS